MSGRVQVQRCCPRVTLPSTSACVAQASEFPACQIPALSTVGRSAGKPGPASLHSPGPAPGRRSCPSTCRLWPRGSTGEQRLPPAAGKGFLNAQATDQLQARLRRGAAPATAETSQAAGSRPFSYWGKCPLLTLTQTTCVRETGARCCWCPPAEEPGRRWRCPLLRSAVSVCGHRSPHHCKCPSPTLGTADFPFRGSAALCCMLCMSVCAVLCVVHCVIPYVVCGMLCIMVCNVCCGPVSERLGWACCEQAWRAPWPPGHLWPRSYCPGGPSGLLPLACRRAGVRLEDRRVRAGLLSSAWSMIQHSLGHVASRARLSTGGPATALGVRHSL